MKKISVILPTNRLNHDVFVKIKNIQDALDKYDFTKKKIFTDEFIDLIKLRTLNVNHYLQITLNSLAYQNFKDFELIISHRYPEDALDVVKQGWNFPIKLVREKHSIWHDLGKQYPTLNNNINTAIIHSQGELLWRLDDLTFFNDNVLGELWNNWKNGYYSTSRGLRCIDYNEDNKNVKKCEKVGAGKYNIWQNGWYGQYKPLTMDGNSIPKWMSWGFSSTIGIDDFLNCNGQEELFDGAICGTDMELGQKLQMISKYNRKATIYPVYEINDVPYKYQTRDDVKFRQIINRQDYHGNCWKPTQEQMDEYAEWHRKNKGELDENWNKFMDVEYLNMRDEYKLKRLGEVIYSNG